MAKVTQKSLLIAGLKACGWKEDPTARSAKYVVFIKPNNENKLLVGKSGGFRKTKGAISKSLSLTGGAVHQAFVKVGESQGWTSTEQAERAYRQFLNDIRLAKAKAKK